jgi:hypothetical protein
MLFSISTFRTFQFTNSSIQNDLNISLDFTKANFSAIKSDLRLVDWHSVLNMNDINKMWNTFCHILHNIFAKHCPPRKSSLPTKNKNLPAYIMSLIRAKRRAWRYYRQHKSDTSLATFRSFAQITRKTIRSFYKKREQDILQSRNTRHFYSYVNQRLYPPPATPQLRDLNNPNALLVDHSQVANAFNTYFGSVFSQDDLSQSPAITLPKHNQMPDVVFDSTKIRNILKTIKSSSSGPDNLHSTALKNLCDELAPPLSLIFTKSYQLSVLPSSWLTSLVSPIYKGSGSRTSADNYRPVSLTSLVCKTMETIIKDCMLTHLMSQSLITPYQHGFLPKRSTLSALVSTYFNWISSYAESKHTHCIYFDLSKAFDSVCHRKLIHKLSYYSLHPLCLNWIKAFLSGRTQKVKIKQATSFPSVCTSGVPQGSVLSSILFLLYMNDLPQIIKHSNICLFADDVKLYTSVNSLQDKQNLQIDINSLAEWCKTWNLKLNLKKCAALNIGPLAHNWINCSYFLDNAMIPTNQSYKDLGILTPDDLHFKNHCYHLVNIAHARANLIIRAFSFSNIQTLCKLYCVYVRPLLEYCSPIWSPYTLELIDLLENVQRTFTRRLPGLVNLNYSERLVYLNLPLLELRRLRADCNLMYNIMHNKFYTMQNLFNLRSDAVSTNVITRGHNLRVFAQYSNCNIVKYSFFHRITNVWNALPNSVVNAPNIKLFNEHLLDTHLLKYLHGRALI